MAGRGTEEVRKGARETVKSCDHCGASFKTLGGFNRHKCAKARLIEEIGDIGLARAYDAFDFWYRYNGFGKKKGKSYQDFLKSPYFKLFTALEKTSIDSRIGPIKEYIRWISDRRIPSSDWTNNDVIMKYRTESSKNVDAEKHVMQSLEQIAAWCDLKGYSIETFFSNIGPGEAAQWVHVGKLSPWILLATDRLSELLSRMTDEQILYFTNMFDIDYWEKRAKQSPEKIDVVKRIISEVGL